MKIKKQVSLLSQKLLAWFCRFTSTIFQLSSSGSSWCGETNKNGAKSEWHYFSDWGPKMLITRNGQVRYLMSAFAIQAEYDTTDQTGHVISCLPLLMKLEADDEVIFGYEPVYREYSRLLRVWQ